MVLTLVGVISAGVEVVDASAYTTGCAGSAVFGATATVRLEPGIISSIAALATTPNATAPPTHASESRQTRANFIAIPTLPLGIKCGIRVNKTLPDHPSIRRSGGKTPRSRWTTYLG